jgi:hypothetical protein
MSPFFYAEKWLPIMINIIIISSQSLFFSEDTNIFSITPIGGAMML